MKARWLIFAVVLLPAFGLSGGISVRNPATRSPVGIATAPVSSYSNGMVTTGVPTDPANNPAITGNLRDGKNSHWNAPYRSSTGFDLNLSSSSANLYHGAPLLNSFVRDSAGSEFLGLGSGYDYAARPYLSTTDAGARAAPNRKEVLSPWNVDSRNGVFQRGNTVASSLYPVGTTRKRHVPSGQEKATNAAGLQRFQKQLWRPSVDYPGASRIEDQTSLTGDGLYRPQFDKSAPSGQGKKMTGTDGFELSCRKRSEQSLNLAVEPNNIQPKTGCGQEHSEALGRIKQQLDELSRSVESRLQTGPGFEQEPESVGDSESVHRTKPEIPNPAPKARGLSDPELAGSSYRLKIHEPTSREAKLAIGGHENRNSLAAHKFSGHVQDAEDYLRFGKYYKAANSFTRALACSRDNPQALAGKSHALFAAGEYMSSAMLLTRALAINPSYAKVRVDFVAILGGSNQLARRLADIERWSNRSSSGRLQLLLGYVYYKTGRLSEAKRAIKAARAKIPESPAVGAIIAAISDAHDQ